MSVVVVMFVVFTIGGSRILKGMEVHGFWFCCDD